MKHVSRMALRVRYADVDKMNVIYYANYLAYFEAARTEFLRELGHDYAELEACGVFLVVSEQNCRYRGSAGYDEVITVRCWVSRLRRTRVDFSYDVLNASGRLLVEGCTVLGCVNTNRRPQPLPDDVAQTLAAHVIDGGRPAPDA